MFGIDPLYVMILSPALILAGLLLFSLAVLFSLITLPVEWNASARARRLMVSAGIVGPSEQSAAGAVLKAASVAESQFHRKPEKASPS